MQDKMTEEEEIIHEFSTKQALAAGLYVDCTDLKQNTDQAFQFNGKVFVTKSLFELCENNELDLALYDLIFAATLNLNTNPDHNLQEVKLNNQYATVWAQIEGYDNEQNALIICMPEER